MRIVSGMVVKSVAGHDKGGLFVVVGEKDGKLLIADGRRRKVQKPKLKKPCHLVYTDAALTKSEYQTNRQIKAGLRVLEQGFRS